MIIGCMGKGGSGKSTFATLLLQYLSGLGNTVLAIDADHNMDLTYNLLGKTEVSAYIGQGLDDVMSACDARNGEKYPHIFERDTLPGFSFTQPQDAFSAEYAHPVSERAFMMVAGPHTERILHGQYCSHSLVTPLKVYLPLLVLKEREYVVVDEKAGSDGAGAGISTGMDAACIIVEPTKHGVKAAQQIADLLVFYGTPYVFVGNKILSDEDKEYLVTHLSAEPACYLASSPEIRGGELTLFARESFDVLLNKLNHLNKNNRIERTVEKFRRNKEHASM